MKWNLIPAIIEDSLRGAIALSIAFFITCCGLSLLGFAGVI